MSISTDKNEKTDDQGQKKNKNVSLNLLIFNHHK